MKTRFLFPHSFKAIGWALLIPALLAGLLKTSEIVSFPEVETAVFSLTNPNPYASGDVFGPFSWSRNDIVDEVISILLIAGALLAGFSKEKVEDEYIARIRLESLLWATYINYGVLLLGIVFIYGPGFFNVVVYNMFTLLLIFLLRFNFILFRNAQASRHEEYA